VNIEIKINDFPHKLFKSTVNVAFTMPKKAGIMRLYP